MKLPVVLKEQADGYYQLLDATGRVIAVDLGRYDALDIRRALNRDKAHEAMKEALRAALPVLNWSYCHRSDNVSQGETVIRQATAALAMAEEEK